MTAEFEKFSEIRRRFKAAYDEICAKCPLTSKDEWLRRVRQTEKCGWAVACSYMCLPTIGEEITACVTIRDDSEFGLVQWEHRWNVHPDVEASLDDQPPAQFAEGKHELREAESRKFAETCASFWDSGGADYPSECYDGTPVSIIVTRLSHAETKSGSCNICDSGSHVTRQLAQLVVESVESIRDRAPSSRGHFADD